MLLFWLYGTTQLVELLIYLPVLWRTRRALSFGLIALLPTLTLFIVFTNWGWTALILLLITIYRVINLLRILQGRSHPRHLYNRCRLTSWRLALASLLCLGLLISVVGNFDSGLIGWLVKLQLIFAVSLGLITARNIHKSRYSLPVDYYNDAQLPSVTLAIPARNETLDLEECLRSVLASDYPKLEVIVLDDCSHAETAAIIKSFAQAGVRFFNGHPPSENWLAKNQAYQKLSEEASGEYIVFCGVDVRLGPLAIRQLISSMLSRQKVVASVLPRRLSGTPSVAFIQPMRYWWELALPRRIFNRPPVLSTCWAIQKSFLKRHGGFAAVSNNILPERYFARQATASDGYSFWRAHDQLDVQTAKQLGAQRETALRLRYPQVSRQPEIVLLISSGLALLMLLPFVLLIISFFVDFGGLRPLLLATCTLLVANHLVIVSVSNPVNVPIALLNFPIVILTELVLGSESMLKYEFGTVEWKGRNICIPVMHVVPRLPKDAS